MGTKEEVTKRFEGLIKQGQGLIGTLGPAVSIIHADGRTEFDQKSYDCHRSCRAGGQNAAASA